MKWFWNSAFAIFFLAISIDGFASEDSVGVKVINGKAYVLHKVDPGDNLTKLSNRYRSSVATIVELNDLDGEVVKVGQVLRIPSRSKRTSLSLSDVAPTPAPRKSNSTPSSSKVHATSGDQGPVKHIVQKGETLYAISRKYKVSVTEIQKWNNLEGAGIQTGQVLIVSAPSSQPKEVIEKPAEPKEVKPVEDSSVGQEESSNPAPAAQEKVVHTVTSGETLYGISRKYGVAAA